MVEGAVRLKVSILQYAGIGVGKGFPSPNTNKHVLYFQPCSTDGDYASIMPGLGKDGSLSLNARFQTIPANITSWLQFCYICK